MADVTGWDIGGAHLKAVRLAPDGKIRAAVQLACPLWRGLDQLERAMAEAVASLGLTGRHAITMTGELADIFPNRQTGVHRIVETMQTGLPECSLHIFAGQHGFVAPEAATQHAAEIASANWLASARFAAESVMNGVLVDMGSTTTDIVPLQAGRAQPQALTDAGRLASDELVYTGIIRTPVMSIVQRVPFAGQWQRLAAEHFATMADVYRLTGQLDAAHDMADTADGAGKSMAESARRLARMVGRDLEDAEMAAWLALARYIAQSQLQEIRAAVERVLSPAPSDAPLVGAGAGRFVVRELAAQMQRAYVDFADLVEGDTNLRDWSAVCAPAYAVARLGADA